ncbi:MAG: hypothetical protein Q4D04_00780 [Clostridia bacterium]|nr:hypothetical protein [Clostridia bacterium]
MDATPVLTAVLPVVFMLLLGVLARKRQLLTQNGADGLKALVMNITLPAVLLSTLIDTSYTPQLWLLAGMMFASALGSWALGVFLKKRMCDMPRLLPFMTSGFEAGMLGYALFTILYGQENLYYMAVMDIGQMLFVFTIYFATLSATLGNKASFASTMKDMIKTPVVDAAILGSLLGATGLGGAIMSTPAGSVVKETLSFIGAPTAAVILFVVGYGLDFSADSRPKGVVKICLLRLGITAALLAVFLIVERFIFPHSQPLYFATILEFMLPIPYILALLVREPDEKTLVSSTISLSTLFTIFVFAALAIAKAAQGM